MRNRDLIPLIFIPIALAACSTAPKANPYEKIACENLRQIQTSFSEKANLNEGVRPNALALARESQNLSSGRFVARSDVKLADKDLAKNKRQVISAYKHNGC